MELVDKLWQRGRQNSKQIQPTSQYHEEQPLTTLNFQCLKQGAAYNVRA